jgi:hypothetical protein
MMRSIPDHEIVRGKGGELAVLIDVIGPEAPRQPVFVVSRNESKGYLRRSPGDVWEVAGITTRFIDEVRRAAVIAFLEVQGPDVIHGYDAPTALLEDGQAPDERKVDKEYEFHAEDGTGNIRQQSLAESDLPVRDS